MSSNSPGGVYEILGADLLRPENRYLNVPLIRLITAGRLPEAALLKIARARRAAMATLWAGREMHQGILRELDRRYPAIAAA